MSIFGGLWAGVKSVFGTSSSGVDNVMTVAKGVGNWIDEQQFTPEEKAKYNAELVQTYAGFLAQTVDESTERSRTRRAIALLIIRWWLFMLTVTMVVWQFNSQWADFMLAILLGAAVSGLVLGVGAFFFGVHILRAAK